MKSLIAEFKCKNRWYPQPVSKYKDNLKIPLNSSCNERIICNYAYNMQYIEFIEKELSDLNLSTVISTMLYKTYIITAMGIIESLFSCLLKEQGYWKTSCWEEIYTFQTNEKEINNEKYMLKNTLYKKGKEKNIRMDFDAMIKKVESKNLLNIEHDVFPALKQLRELRNRVHLHLGDRYNDHDYNNFNWNEILLARKILYTVITCSEFCYDKSLYNFMKEKIDNFDKIRPTF